MEHILYSWDLLVPFPSPSPLPRKNLRGRGDNHGCDIRVARVPSPPWGEGGRRPDEGERTPGTNCTYTHQERTHL